MPTAWWVNFGSYVRGAEGDAPYLVGFTGFGTLGGGNLSMRTGGDAGNIAPRGDGSIPSSGNLNPRSQDWSWRLPALAGSPPTARCNLAAAVT